jgi:hypothetical protein
MATPVSYSKYRPTDLEALGISVQTDLLFQKISPIMPSDLLKTVLSKNLQRHLRSEKAKSEFIIAPILAEIEERNQQTIALFSGYNFEVDKSLGLKGFCDFIFSKDPKSLNIAAPVFCVVEAKNDNLDIGISQCFAEMYAATIFNKQKKQQLSTVYGAVTTGYAWQFLRLENNIGTADTMVYSIDNLPLVIGILDFICH